MLFLTGTLKQTIRQTPPGTCHIVFSLPFSIRPLSQPSCHQMRLVRICPARAYLNPHCTNSPTLSMLFAPAGLTSTPNRSFYLLSIRTLQQTIHQTPPGTYPVRVSPPFQSDYLPPIFPPNAQRAFAPAKSRATPQPITAAPCHRCPRPQPPPLYRWRCHYGAHCPWHCTPASKHRTPPKKNCTQKNCAPQT